VDNPKSRKYSFKNAKSTVTTQLYQKDMMGASN
jgi:hypothetical protein